ncbi:MGMT family protein [Gammaproteobacteria bacterium]|nr:MGMT family protein [Gammaproteobacteria bacterium]
MPSKFQILVWNEIDKIDSGQTISYKQLAINIQRPNSARAVANACGKNPNPIKTPCHRVIKSNGSIGGYSGKGGIQVKRKLLAQEGVYL